MNKFLSPTHLSSTALIFIQLLFVIGSHVRAFDGQLDPTFGTNGIVTNSFDSYKSDTQAIALSSNGVLYALGTIAQPTPALGIASYESSGLLDLAFNPKGSQPGLLLTTCGTCAMHGTAMALDDQGRILGAGSTGQGSTHFLTLRASSQGALDITFDHQGFTVTTFGGHTEIPQALAYASGKIFVAGISDGDLAVACYTASGSLDTTFADSGLLKSRFFDNKETWLLYRLSGAAVQPDGKLIVGGTFVNPEMFFIARYLPTGQLDSTFNPNGPQKGVIVASFGQASGSMRALALQENGQIVVGGSVPAAGIASLALARYNSNGTLDTTFNAQKANPGIIILPLVNQAAQIEAVTIQPDGKIIAAAAVQGYRSMTSAVARFTASGELDTSFNPDGEIPGLIELQSSETFSSTPSAIILQPDGKIVVSGKAQQDELLTFMLFRLLNDNENASDIKPQ